MPRLLSLVTRTPRQIYPHMSRSAEEDLPPNVMSIMVYDHYCGVDLQCASSCLGLGMLL